MLTISNQNNLHQGLKAYRKTCSIRLFITILIVFQASLISSQTSGPTQPDFQAVMTSGEGEHVDLFTGDFSYSIPIADLDGFPLTLSYSAGVTKDQEASWVGLGWNFNPGSISRQVRGFPDDFKADKIKKVTKIKPITTFGISGKWADLEIPIGMLDFGVTTQIYHNSATGFGLRNTIGLSGSMSAAFGSRHTLGMGASGALNITLDSNSPIANVKGSLSASLAYNIRKKEKEQGKLKNHNVITAKGDLSKMFSSPSHTPSYELPMNNFGMAIGVKGGIIAMTGLFANSGVTAFYTKQSIANEVVNINAYGYRYLSDYNNGVNELADINRDNDGLMSQVILDQPVPHVTFDLHSVSVPGFSGTFRAYRTDIGIFSSNEFSKSSHNIKIGFDFGAGNIIHTGINGGYTRTTNKGGKWELNSEVSSEFKFLRESTNSRKEEVYYRLLNENSQQNHYQGNVWNKGLSVPNINDDEFTSINNEVSSQHNSAIRQARNTMIKEITKVDVRNGKGSSNLNYYDLPIGVEDHHIIEYQIIDENGVTYIFGRPVFNIIKRETRFSVGDDVEEKTNLVNYNTDQNGSIEHQFGDQELFSEMTTPIYAHSYLLTEIRNADYIDSDEQIGPSDGDIGNYTKISYTRTDPSSIWRIPIQENMGIYSEGLSSIKDDDFGYFESGVKELWYVNKIETKNKVADFIMTDRLDVVKLSNMHGDRDNSGNTSYKRLDKIVIRNKKLESNERVIAKSVDFNYDYSIAKENQDSDRGKLTLKELKYNGYSTFLNEDVQKGSYLFKYSNYNPNIEDVSQSPWGTVREDLPVSENFPYSNQLESSINNKSKDELDRYSSAWNLKEVKTPSNGLLKVEYEQDDYSYVQDKGALIMYKVLGFSDTPQGELKSSFYNGVFTSNGFSGTINNYIIIEVPGVNSENIDNYIDGLEELFFSMDINIDELSNNTIVERIEGFVKLDMGFDYEIRNNVSNRIYIELPIKDYNKGIDRIDFHPIQFASLTWLKGRLNKVLNSESSCVSFSGDELDPEVIANQVLGMLGCLDEQMNILSSIIQSYYSHTKANYCKGIVDNYNSYVRLNSANGKIGGGHRVKAIRKYDNWSDTEGDAVMGYRFEYNDPNTGKSNGVAQYEPSIMQLENPLVVPVRIPDSKDRLEIASPTEQFLLTPLTKGAFPSAVVGYTNVRKFPIYETIGGVKVNPKNPLGYEEQVFYTAKDFPVISKASTVDNGGRDLSEIIGDVFESILLGGVSDTRSFGQGYVTIKNGMHGKLHSVRQYSSSQTIIPVTQRDYFYNFNDLLNQEIRTLNSSLEVSVSPHFGETIDAVIDSRKSETMVAGGNIGVNVQGSIFPPFIPIVAVYPELGLEYENKVFQSAVINKTINQNGILERIDTRYNGKLINSEENLLYDEITAKPLLSSSFTNFGSKIYSLKIPAYWNEESMTHAYQNSDFKFELEDNSNYSNLFIGDRLMMKSDNSEVNDGINSIWYLKSQSGDSQFIDRYGERVSDLSGIAEVVSSGAKNISNLIQTNYVLSHNPIQGNSLVLDEDRIVDVNHVEFTNKRILNNLFTENILFRQNCLFDPGERILSNNYSVYLFELVNSILRSGNVLSIDFDCETLNSDYLGVNYSGEFNNDKIIMRFSEIGIYSFSLIIDCIAQNVLRIEELSGPFFYEDNPVDICGDRLIVEATKKCWYPSQIINEQDSTSSYINIQTRVVIKDYPIEYLVPKDIDKSYTFEKKCLLNGKMINPFTIGLVGSFIPLSSHSFKGSDFNGSRSFNINSIEESGHLSGFSHFAPNDIAWRAENIATAIDQNGKTIESMNIDGVYNCSEYDPKHRMSTLFAKNAKLNQVGYEGWESYIDEDDNCQRSKHFEFTNIHQEVEEYEGDVTFTEEAKYVHTGNYALKMEPGISLEKSWDVSRASWEYEISKKSDFETPYLLNASDMVVPFAPEPGTYHFSMWVKNTVSNVDVDYKVQVECKSSNTVVNSIILTPDSSINIDGWIMLHGTIVIPSSAVSFSCVHFNDGNHAVVIDDLRFHPINSIMENYVYDEFGSKIIAELDGNNFARFFQYNIHDEIIRVNQETIDGIQTLKESEVHLTKGN